MKLLYTSSNALVVNHLRNLLESEGLDSQLKNEFLYSAAGEIPPHRDLARAVGGGDGLSKGKSHYE